MIEAARRRRRDRVAESLAVESCCRNHRRRAPARGDLRRSMRLRAHGQPGPGPVALPSRYVTMRPSAPGSDPMIRAAATVTGPPERQQPLQYSIRPPRPSAGRFRVGPGLRVTSLSGIIIHSLTVDSLGRAEVGRSIWHLDSAPLNQEFHGIGTTHNFRFDQLMLVT